MRQIERIEQHKKSILDALKVNVGNISRACAAVGISRGTFYNYLNADPDFAETVHEVREERIDRAESELYTQIEAGNLTAVIFFLKTQAKHRGYCEHHSAPDAAERKILTDYAAGSIDAIQAGTRYAMIGRPLPDVLRMQLAKMEPPETDAGDEGVYTDEELEADFQAMQAKVGEEKDRWLPERRAAVADLKKEIEGAGEKEDAIHD